MKKIVTLLTALSSFMPALAQQSYAQTTQQAENASNKSYIGVLLFESTGAQVSVNGNGHLAVVLSDMCTDDYLKVRHCKSGETPGVVINRYLGIIKHPSLQFAFQVLPLGAAFSISDDFANAPILVTGRVTKKMTVDYWKKNFRNTYPSLSNDEVQTLVTKDKDFQYSLNRAKNPLGAIFMMLDAVTLKNLSEEQWVNKSVYYSEPDLNIPMGRWNSALGIRHTRDTLLAYSEMTKESEENVMNYINTLTNSKDVFSALTNNCSDFVKDVLKIAYPDIKYKNMLLKPADVFAITSPIATMTDFLGNARRNKIPYFVEMIPQFAGTRMKSVSAKNISEGTVKADSKQHPIAYGLRLLMSQMGPMVGAGVEIAKLIQNDVNVDSEVHKRDLNILSSLQNELVLAKQSDSPDKNKTVEELKNTISERQVLTFGTRECWSAKQKELASLSAYLGEHDLISKEELKFLDPKADIRNLGKSLEQAGLSVTYQTDGKLIYKIGKKDSSERKYTGATRSNILDYQTNPNLDKGLALKILMAAVNWDLRADTADRRTTQEFDADWDLLLNVLKDTVPTILDKKPELQKGLFQCSADQIDSNKKVSDIRGNELKLTGRIVAKAKAQFLGPMKFIFGIFNKNKVKKNSDLGNMIDDIGDDK